MSMIAYHIKAATEGRHFLDIDLYLQAPAPMLRIGMPWWRPGRYEAGNFVKNVSHFRAAAGGGRLPTRKLSANTWEVTAAEHQEVHISYRLYAAELSAGNTFSSDELLLINPVNSLLYVTGLEQQPCLLHLHVPAGWQSATALRPHPVQEHCWEADDLDQLMDSPLLFAPSLQRYHYRAEGVSFTLHVQGGELPRAEESLRHFAALSTCQIQAFGGFPEADFHFMLLLHPLKAYHGVEHSRCTVLLMGPREQLPEPMYYRELLGLASHELYHVWNVKHLRPADWWPYRYDGPMYSPMGYIAEGVTTYMGDKMLWQAAVFDTDAFLTELSTHLQRHLDNEGRYSMGLAEASIDTWVDGYGRSSPRRRVSIYVEGALLALVCDAALLHYSDGHCDLSSHMRALYQSCAHSKRLSEERYWQALSESCPGQEHFWGELRRQALYTPNGLLPYLEELPAHLGLEFKLEPSPQVWERNFGFAVTQQEERFVVSQVRRGSPAEVAGLWFGDQLLSINGSAPQRYFGGPDPSAEALELISEAQGVQRSCSLSPDGRSWMHKARLQQAPSDAATRLLQRWRRGSERAGRSNE